MLKSMILGQLNCLLFFAFLGSSGKFLKSIRWSFLVCLSKSEAVSVDLQSKLVDAGKKHFLSAVWSLSSTFGKTTIFKDATVSIGMTNDRCQEN